MSTDSYLKATIEALSIRWVDSLRQLQEITHPESRRDHIAFLKELYDEAQYIYSQYADHLHPIVKGNLIHIISTDFDRHITVSNKVTNAK